MSVQSQAEHSLWHVKHLQKKEKKKGDETSKTHLQLPLIAKENETEIFKTVTLSCGQFCFTCFETNTTLRFNTRLYIFMLYSTMPFNLFIVKAVVMQSLKSRIVGIMSNPNSVIHIAKNS